MKMNFSFILLSVLLLPLSAVADLGIQKVLIPSLCENPKEDPVESIRKVLAKESEKSIRKKASKWLSEEAKAKKDIPDLNWIRAVNPWLLPEDFPGRPGFVRCASELRTFSDTRDDSSVQEWTECVDSLYAEKRPPEFEALRTCLAATKHVRSEKK